MVPYQVAYGLFRSPFFIVGNTMGNKRRVNRAPPTFILRYFRCRLMVVMLRCKKCSRLYMPIQDPSLKYFASTK